MKLTSTSLIYPDFKIKSVLSLNSIQPLIDFGGSVLRRLLVGPRAYGIQSPSTTSQGAKRNMEKPTDKPRSGWFLCYGIQTRTSILNSHGQRRYVHQMRLRFLVVANRPHFWLACIVVTWTVRQPNFGIPALTWETSFLQR